MHLIIRIYYVMRLSIYGEFILILKKKFINLKIILTFA